MPFWLHQSHMALVARGLDVQKKIAVIGVTTAIVVSLAVYFFYYPYWLAQRACALNRSSYGQLTKDLAVLNDLLERKQAELLLLQKKLIASQTTSEQPNDLIGILEMIRGHGLTYRSVQHDAPKSNKALNEADAKIRLSGPFERVAAFFVDFEAQVRSTGLNRVHFNAKDNGSIDVEIDLCVMPSERIGVVS